MTIKYIAMLFALLFSNHALRENIMHPTAKKIPHEFEIHGTKIQDEYAWLRADGWPENVTDKEVLSYLEEENAYFKIYMSPFEKEKNMFFEELKGRMKLDDQSTYTKKDNFYYYNRTEADKNYPIYCRKKDSTEAPEEIILDVNKLAEGKKFTNLGALAMSPDHTLMAYSVDFTGGERYDVKIFNLKTKEFLADFVPSTIGAIVWHETIPGFFYTPTDKNWRQDKIKFHKLGTDVKDDKIILHEPDPLYHVGAGKSASENYIFIDVNGHDSNEIYYIDMKDASFTPKLFQKRKDQIIYSIDHDGEFFYKHTNDGAKNFHILRAASNGYYSDTAWQVYTGEKSDKYLSSFDLTKSYLLLNYKVMGLAENVVHDLKTGKEKSINFPDAAYTASIYSTNFEENDIRVSYSSLARPSTVYEYDFASGKLEILKVQEIPSGLNSDDYQVERVFAKSEDGTSVPISLFYKKSLFKKDGSNPLYLYGYGSYGIGMPPTFRNSAISLVDRGFVYAIAHIRGGDELGHDWYEAAKFLTKKLTFNDFISCTEHLAREKYTSAGNIVIMGGSAGGMLIGNVINQRPELFKAAIAHVPFVDVLNTMLDGDLPLTPGEYKEWGNPAEKKYFEYIKSYSPYENVTTQNYPNLFITAGLSDPRVGYWEAAKWVARLRAKKTDSNIILYKTNMSFGHRGASGRFDYLKEAAEELVFIMNMFETNSDT